MRAEGLTEGLTDGQTRLAQAHAAIKRRWKEDTAKEPERTEESDQDKVCWFFGICFCFFVQHCGMKSFP